MLKILLIAFAVSWISVAAIWFAVVYSFFKELNYKCAGITDGFNVSKIKINSLSYTNKINLCENCIYKKLNNCNVEQEIETNKQDYICLTKKEK